MQVLTKDTLAGRTGNGTSADFNNDGYQDLLIATDISISSHDYTTPVSAYIYNPTTHNYDHMALTINGAVVDPAIYFGQWVETFDINKDGIVDLLPIDASERTVPDLTRPGGTKFCGSVQYAYVSNGIGNYTQLAIGTDQSYAHGFGVIESVDGKFRMLYNDPVTGSAMTDSASTIATYNTATNQFDVQDIARNDPFFANTPQGAWPSYSYETTLDINNDGNTDIVGFSAGANNNIYMNDGYGTFTYTNTFNSGLVSNYAVEESVEGDFNGDGWMDTVVEGVNRINGSEYKTLRVLINDHNGTFVDQTAQWLGTKFQDVNISYGYLDKFDFNHDGKADFVFTHMATQTPSSGHALVEVLMSNGTSFDLYTLDSELSAYKFGQSTLGGRIIPISDDSFVYTKDWGTVFNAVATLNFNDNSPVVTTYATFTKVNGTEADDKLTGTTGDDYLDGGAGKDILKGGAGNDIYVVDNIKDSVTEKANEGTDKVLSGVNYTLKANFENLELTGTALNGTGNKVANEITGNEQDNVLKGIDGNDTLTGGAGNDKLFGGKGNDNLTGGAGNDVFVFDTKGTATIANIDEILDFAAGDTLQFKKGVFGKAGAVLADDFVSEAGAVAHDKTDHWMFDTNSGNLYYDADGSGAKAAIQVAHLIGITDLHNTDLFIA